MKLGFGLQRPRRHHIKANKDEQELFKNHTLLNKVISVTKEHPTKFVEVWSEDEHSMGLQTIIRGVWSEKSRHSVSAPVNPGYEWFYMYCFVHSKSGRSHDWILPTCNKDMFELAESFGAGDKKQIIFVVDQAT